MISHVEQYKSYAIRKAAELAMEKPIHGLAVLAEKHKRVSSSKIRAELEKINLGEYAIIIRDLLKHISS